MQSADVTAVVEGDRILVRSPFRLKEVAKTITGATWDKQSRLWHYPADSDTANAIRKAYNACMPAIDGLAVDMDMLRLLASGETAQASHKVKQVLDLPRIPGRYCNCDARKPGDVERGTNPLMCENCTKPLDDMRHQREAYAFLKDTNGAAGMGMGTGKTKLYVGLLDGREAQHALIITTKKGRRVFPKQFRLHSERNWSVMNAVVNRKGEPKKTAPLREYVEQAESAIEFCGVTGQPFALVVHYDVIWRAPMRDFLLKFLKEHKPCIIYDESHRIKSPGGKASRAAATFQRHADRVWLGTGSLMAHTKLDVYGQMRACRPSLFGTNFNKFKRQYAVLGGFEDREVVGWQHEDEFNDKLSQAAFMVDTDDVLDLPPAVDIVREVDLSPEAYRILAALDAEFTAEVADGRVTASNALSKLLRQQQVTSGYAVLDSETEDPDERETRQVDTAKRDELAEILNDLDPSEQVVVFCRFTADLANVRAVAAECGRAYGEVSGNSEDLTADATIPDHVNVLGVQVQSGSEAVDFTASRYNVYYSVGFSLKDFEQSKRRSDRPGQLRHVFRFHLVARNTIDEKVYAALAERKAVIQTVVNYVKGSESE